jgi:hypothetical protein
MRAVQNPKMRRKSWFFLGAETDGSVFGALGIVPFYLPAGKVLAVAPPGVSVKVFGPLFEFLVADHARLSGLLERVTGDSGTMDLPAYHSFRSGLLKHIGMEEKIVFPALERAHGVSPATAARFRRGYRALAALLALPPSAAIVRTLGTVLCDHDRLERAPGGPYEACERLDEETRAALLSRVRSAPEVPVAPLREGSRALEVARRALARAGYDVDDQGSLRPGKASPVKPR